MDITAAKKEAQKNIEVFCCYARKDQSLLHELKKHLMPLLREGSITFWADTDINAGAEWEKEIHLHLNAASIILLLVSPDFIASTYCYSIEMQRAMERHEHGEALVIPIILRPADWQKTPFGKLQVLPNNAKSVANRDRYVQDKAFLTIVEGIRRALEALKQTNSLIQEKPTPLLPIQEQLKSVREPHLVFSSTGDITPSIQKYRQIELGNEELPEPSLERLKLTPLSSPRNTFLTRLLVLAMVILFLGGIGGFLYANYYPPKQQHINATATSQVLGATMSRSNATATAAIATSDAIAASHRPYPPQGAKLVLEDSLQGTSHGYGWKTDSANCQFPGDGYHIAIDALPDAFSCFGSKTDFSNFVFESRMTILRGDAGGLAFRADPNNSKYYEFEVDHNGHYGFYEYTTWGNKVTGASGQISGFHTGVGQSNLVAVKVQGDEITFYDNYHFITTATYYDFSHGQIGFEASSNTNPTEVVFTDAKVWKI
jgi:TIR domain